ncbi:MAG: hypothetical protein M1840_007990 [Geoglossum simile]|nr:MAG: hypothetical protein M1840_007990 [Geoglossum simile]
MVDSVAAALGRHRCARGRAHKKGQKKSGWDKEPGTLADVTTTGGSSQDKIAATSSTRAATPAETVASAGAGGTMSKNTRQKARKGKKFLPLPLDPTQSRLPSTSPGLKTYVQQAKGGASPGGSFATAARLTVPTQPLPEEFSEDHFPSLGSVALAVRDKRTLPKPSEWAPPNDPKRDEAEEIALRMIEEQRNKEDGGISWLRDPPNPINGCREVISGTPTPTDGLLGGTPTGGWTAGRISDGSRTKLLKAPYVFNEKWEFGKPRSNQKSKLFTLSTEMLSDIFYQMDRQSRIRFTRTSRASSELMSRTMTVWDMSGGDFCDAEKGPMGDSGPTAITVVTEFNGSPAKNTVRHEINVLKAMTLSFSLWTRVFRVVEFHRAPLVSMDLLQYIIPALPNLKYLGIFECNLMHVGETIPLLHAIRKNVRLDFFPRRPICHDVNIAIRIALSAMLFTILPLAKRKGSRLIERHSAFESYLRVELPGIPIKQFKRIGDGVQDKQLTEIISAYKDCISHPCPVDPKSNNGRLWECEGCNLELRGCFFAKAQFKEPHGPVCWGCKLKQALNEEKYDKRIDGHRHIELNYWHGDCSTLGEVVEAVKNECKERDDEKTFIGYYIDDHRAKLARSKFCNPRFYRQARAAWLKGEDPNDWWPEKQASAGHSGRRARRRGGW